MNSPVMQGKMAKSKEEAGGCCRRTPADRRPNKKKEEEEEWVSAAWQSRDSDLEGGNSLARC